MKLEIIKKIADEGNGKIWEKSGKFRVYWAYRRDVTIYSDYEDGWSLKCFVNTCGQSVKWYISQRKIAIANVTPLHNMLLGSDYLDEPATAYSPETNAEFNEAAAKVNQVVLGRV